MCSVIAGLTALAGYSQYRQQQQAADSQAAAYRAQAEAANQNAHIEARKQEQIADNYAQEASNLRARQRIAEGAQRAQAGSAGIGFSGSQMDILSSGLDAYNTDQMNLLSNQRNDNYASRVTQTNYLNQANSMNAAASNVENQAKWSGISTILGTAASIYGVAQPWKNAGSTAQASNIGTVTTGLGYGTTYNTTGTGGYFAGTGTNALTGRKFFSKDYKLASNGYGW